MRASRSGKMPTTSVRRRISRLSRLVSAVLAEQHDEWTEGRRYLGLDVLGRCRIRPVADTDNDPAEEVTIPALSA